jgi:hypothetical protein
VWGGGCVGDITGRPGGGVSVGDFPIARPVGPGRGPANPPPPLKWVPACFAGDKAARAWWPLPSSAEFQNGRNYCFRVYLRGMYGTALHLPIVFVLSTLTFSEIVVSFLNI